MQEDGSYWLRHTSDKSFYRRLGGTYDNKYHHDQDNVCGIMAAFDYILKKQHFDGLKEHSFEIKLEL